MATVMVLGILAASCVGADANPEAARSGDSGANPTSLPTPIPTSTAVSPSVAVNDWRGSPSSFALSDLLLDHVVVDGACTLPDGARLDDATKGLAPELALLVNDVLDHAAETALTCADRSAWRKSYLSTLERFGALLLEAESTWKGFGRTEAGVASLWSDAGNRQMGSTALHVHERLHWILTDTRPRSALATGFWYDATHRDVLQRMPSTQADALVVGSSVAQYMTDPQALSDSTGIAVVSGALPGLILPAAPSYFESQLLSGFDPTVAIVVVTPLLLMAPDGECDFGASRMEDVFERHERFWQLTPVDPGSLSTLPPPRLWSGPSPLQDQADATLDESGGLAAYPDLTQEQQEARNQRHESKAATYVVCPDRVDALLSMAAVPAEGQRVSFVVAPTSSPVRQILSDRRLDPVGDFVDEARRHGISITDHSDALQDEHFIDHIHVSSDGRSAITPLLATHISEELAAAEASATPMADLQHPRECRAPQTTRALNLTMDVGGLDRSADIHLPEQSREAVQPLVINFHGIGGSSVSQQRYTAMNALADELGFVAVHPQGLPASRPHALTSWEVVPHYDEPGRDDAAFVEVLIDRLVDDYCVDPQRVYVMGMSNGGLFASTLVCRISDLIAGAAAVAGTYFGPDCDPDRHVPFIAFHGTTDRDVRFDGDQSTMLLDPSNGSMLDEFTQFASSAQCQSSAEEQLSPDVIRHRWTSCDDGAEYWFHTLVDVGHQWPGPERSERSIENLGATTNEIDAGRAAWDFFEQFTLDG